MAISDFTGQNIQDTYQRVVQTDNTNQLADGTGSIFIPVSSSHAITASHALFAVSASHEITFELSSSYAQTASFANNFTVSDTITADKIRAGGYEGSSVFDIAAGVGGIDTDGAMSCTGFSNSSTTSLGGRLTLSGEGSFIQTPSYVSASRVIATQITSSESATISGELTVGSNVTFDQSLTVNNDINVSGHISASNITLPTSTDSILKILNTDSSTTHEFHGRGNAPSFLAIPTAQNLGVGLPTTQAPSSKLHINGDITIDTNITASGNISASGTGSFGDGRFSNKVGINTLTPSVFLHIKKPNSGGDYIHLERDGQRTFAISGDDQSTNKDFSVKDITAGTRPFLIAGSTGNVGINTQNVNPGEKLTVHGNISASGNIKANYIETAKIPLIQYISDDTTSVAQGRVLAAGSHDNASDSFALEWSTPLFEDTDFFETGSVSPTTAGTINNFAVKQDGRYEINCNVAFRGESGARPGINLGIFTSSNASSIGDFRPAGPSAHAYVRVASPAMGSTAAIPGFVIQLSSGSAINIKVDLKDDFGGTGNTFWSGSLSHFSMKKIG